MYRSRYCWVKPKTIDLGIYSLLLAPIAKRFRKEKAAPGVTL
jgi:hypothetical protein